MDSGNSGSLQSSSGGDDQEYDSSSFPSFHFNPHPSLVSSHQPTFLSTNPHFLNPPFSLSQPDPIPPPTLRSEPDHPTPAPPVTKNPKKRTRASRRAPTTVLTTDTSNFRQMVQEFTGIPTAPFSGSASFSSRRFDLFSTAGSSMRSATAHLEPTSAPLYPLRPSPLKLQAPSLFASSSSSSNPTLLLNNNSAISQSLLNMQTQNPLLSFQPSLLPFNLPGFDAKSPPQQGNAAAIPSLEELGVAANTMRSRSDGAWRGDEESGNSMRNINYGGNSQRVSGNSCKLNYSAAASSDFLQHDKGLENVATRAEGTVESWICPSD